MAIQATISVDILHKSEKRWRDQI